MQRLLLLIFIFFTSQTAFAQAQEGGDVTGQNLQYEFGAIIGNLLPNQIPGLTEITGLGGVRVGYRISPMVVAEAGLLAGNGEGAKYKDLFLGARIDVPVDTMVGSIYGGIDTIYYQGVGMDQKLYGGGHVGGGLQFLIGGSLWMRADMKFNINPGTSMFIGLSFVFRFGSAGGGS